MTQTLRFASAALICLLAVGCSTATFVRQDAHAGEIAVDGSYMHSISRARAMAVEHCNGRVTLSDPSGPHNIVTFSCMEEQPVLLVDASLMSRAHNAASGL